MKNLRKKKDSYIMLIGIDGNEANVEKRVGISEYVFELLRQFSSSKFKVQSSKFIIYLKDKSRKELPREDENWNYRVVKPGKMWTQFALPLDLYLHKPRPQVFFSPTHYSPRFCPSPTAISIMDLSFIYYPTMFKKSDLYQLKNWTFYSVRKAERVFTISKATRNDIIKIYKIPEEKVAVTYPGVKFEIRNSKFEMNPNIKMRNSKLLSEKYRIEGDYILFVGTLQPRKNITRLIEAFSKLKNNKLELIIIGKKGWLYEEILSSPKKFEIENRVKFLDFVPDEDLPSFYKNAICFVLPSLYEGFGLPILEAMKYGCPVVTSSVSSLPEAGGDAALYVNPENVSDIASKISQLIENDKLRKELIEKGYKQVEKFSWEKTAKKTLEELEKIAINNKSTKGTKSTTGITGKK